MTGASCAGYLEHLFQKESVNNGFISSFSSPFTHQKGGDKVSCMTVYILVLERISQVASTLGQSISMGLLSEQMSYLASTGNLTYSSPFMAFPIYL